METQNNTFAQNISPKKNPTSSPLNTPNDLTSIGFYENSISTMNTLKLTKGARRYSKTQKKSVHLSKLSDYELNQNEEESEKKKSNLFSFSGNDFFMMSSKNYTVHQLEVELQAKAKAMDLKYSTVNE